MGMGQVKKGLVAATSVAMGEDSKVLVVGHQDGNATVWHQSGDAQRISWSLQATLPSAHHGWERTRLVALSRDGSVVLACTDDNVVLWRLPTRTSESEAVAPREVRHLH